jgi:TRAP-type C4-dicarboxylate transport system permease small subunit
MAGDAQVTDKEENDVAPPTAEPDATGVYVSDLPGVLGTLDNAIARIEAVLLAAGVLLMALNTIANVIGRFALGSSIFFSEELNRILIILITFAGISYAARHGRHIRMSAIFDALPGRARKVLMIVIATVTALFMFGLCYFSVSYILSQAGRGRVLPSLQIPVWWILVWVPVGFFMTGMQYALTAIKNLISKDIYLSTGVLEGYGDEEREV